MKPRIAIFAAPHPLVLGLSICLLAARPAAAGDCFTRSNVRSEGPAATLLFPYFEVDLDGGRTTLLSIVNTVQDPDRGVLTRTLARVTVWTDWAIPTMSFDLYLEPGDVQTINMRDLFATGDAPVTRPPAGVYPACGSSLGGHLVAPERLRAQHTGREADFYCYSSPRSDASLATGYVTVDVVRRCSLAGVNPSTAGYFTGVATTDNRLFGDFVLVDPDQNFASGEAAVAVVAAPAAFDPGDYTFYGRYVNFDASDERRAVGSQWAARFITGGAFDGGTQLLVWRDNRTNIVSRVICGTDPFWVPLGEPSGVTIHDEAGNVTELRPTSFFDLATQRVDVRSIIDPPTDFGWFELVMYANRDWAQGWVGWIASAQSRFSAGLSASEVELCAPDP